MAIVPAILAVFLDDPTSVNESLNVLQAIQLPFALIPLIKFNASRNLLGDYSLKKWQAIIYSAIGLLLIFFNVFYQINYVGINFFYEKIIYYENFVLDLSGWKIYVYVLGIIIYLFCIIYLILQPVVVNKEKEEEEHSASVFENEKPTKDL